MAGAESGGSSPPTPARAAMSSGPAPSRAAPPAAAPANALLLEVNGVRWSVRTLGRSLTSKVPLLLLGFFHPDSPLEPRKEALVVGRALEELTESQLELAWRASVEPSRPGTRKPFFPEIEVRGAKDA